MGRACDSRIFIWRVKEHLCAKPLECLCGPAFLFIILPPPIQFTCGVLDASEHPICVLHPICVTFPEDMLGGPGGIVWGHTVSGTKV